MRRTYLILAIVGAVVPYVFFAGYFAEAGLNPVNFVMAAFGNGAAAGFTADLLISSAVFWTFLFSRRSGPSPWLFVLLNLTIGLSCALPAYLYVASGRDVAGPARC